ncbi:MAG: HPP family protein [Coriobacteriia bacterium]|nr:HPP family protein [Coriobacteriia bacterium]
MVEDKPQLSYLQKLKGVRIRSEAPHPTWRESVVAGLGGALAIAILYALTVDLKLVTCFMAPLGATCALVFGLPTAPVSQPRNIIGGHVLSALVGLVVFSVSGQTTWWTMALAVGLAMVAMAMTRTYHPPAAVTALLPVLQEITAFTWVLAPVGLGAMLLVVIAVLYNNLFADRRYPVSWW